MRPITALTQGFSPSLRLAHPVVLSTWPCFRLYQLPSTPLSAQHWDWWAQRRQSGLLSALRLCKPEFLGRSWGHHIDYELSSISLSPAALPHTHQQLSGRRWLHQGYSHWNQSLFSSSYRLLMRLIRLHWAYCQSRNPRRLRRPSLASSRPLDTACTIIYLRSPLILSHSCRRWDVPARSPRPYTWRTGPRATHSCTLLEAPRVPWEFSSFLALARPSIRSP